MISTSWAYFDFAMTENITSLLAPVVNTYGSVSNLSPAIPLTNDKNAPAGTFGDSVFQDIWVVKQILLKSPSFTLMLVAA